ncbi:gamma-mobile-trio protein GmtX [Massilia sp.]|uniref:gamma-mobile-trio protein GmtX n=1 Tax=Massilia sp. TaxID=1882437 RepID=UPI00289B8365|nr:gamma-mobile-trio protein GmtX [Massilia sp.]
MGNDTILDPEQVLQRLQAGAKSQRTRDSLDIINQVCKEQFERKSYDYSYSMIGTLSGGRGGPKAQPIRNATGAVYRTLIDTWQKFANAGGHAPPAQRPTNLENDVLSLISDSVTRILVQKYISENKKLRNENQVLKVAAKEKVVINLSGKRDEAVFTVETHGPIDFLLEQEIFALRNAISAETMRRNGWVGDADSGAVTKGPLTIFSPGFMTAISKIVERLDRE